MSRVPPPPRYGHYELLSPDRKRFVDEYLVDLNAAAAVLRAGFTHSGTGWKLLNNPEVQRAIDEQRDLVANHRGVSGNLWVLGKLWDIATADPGELAEVRRVPCRYCWGINGQYQFTKTEMDRLIKAYEYGSAKQPFNAIWPTGPGEYAAYIAGAHKIPFDPQGGDDYTAQREPNTQCSECGGDGVVTHYLPDTRKLSPGAKKIFRGVKANRDRIEVLVADQDAAVMALAKHYGVAKDRREVWLRNVDPNDLSDDDLMRAVAELRAIDLERSDFATISVDQPSDGVPPEVQRRRRQASLAKARAIWAAKPPEERKHRQSIIRRPKG